MAPHIQQQWVVDGHNGIDSLLYKEAPIPSLGTNDALVRGLLLFNLSLRLSYKQDYSACRFFELPRHHDCEGKCSFLPMSLLPLGTWLSAVLSFQKLFDELEEDALTSGVRDCIRFR